MMLLRLAYKSLLARKISVSLTVLSISVSMFILLAIGHIKNEAKASFTNTVSGVDLIVGPRAGQLNLLLYSVFRIGNPSNNISWQNYQEFAKRDEVAWTIPLSLGDSHLGYRVLGTTQSYFQHFSYGNKQALTFASGKAFAETFDVVMGAEVARKLGYALGQEITLSHGLVSTRFSEHSEYSFKIVGILAFTGTPVDQTVHVHLNGLEAIHEGWQSGVNLSHLEQEQGNNTPESITAFMVGLKSKMATFSFQRKVNTFQPEALLAILPGVALAELWRMMGFVEKLLLSISMMVLVATLLGMSTMMLATMRERQREFAVLRVIGASPWFIVLLIQIEVFLITLVSAVLAVLVLWLSLWLSQDFIAVHIGVFVSSAIVNPEFLLSMVAIVVLAMLIGLVPAISAYRTANKQH